MVGIVEAVGFFGQRLEDVRVLSISTTNYPFRIAEPVQLGGLLGWGQKVIETFMFGQAQGAVSRPILAARGASAHRPLHHRAANLRNGRRQRQRES